ncbi:MAG: methyltransferase domain-containing protein [Burkholderiales bacterium]
MTQEIAHLVAALPERYQPVYGEEDDTAARRCDDRLAVIAAVVDTLRDRLGRPVRVLDLGCAQGYFALSLAARGACVTGVDRGAANIALCRALASRHPGLDAQFVEADVVDFATTLAPDRFDVALVLSVVHHVAHERSPEAARQFVAGCAERAQLLLVETALASEPMYWAHALPEDPRDLFADVPFVQAIARFPTHLSDVQRPLFFASARWWKLGASFERFDRWTAASHEFAMGVHAGTRRYFFGTHLAKQYLLAGPAAERNREELRREEAFLRDPPEGLHDLPRLVASGIELDQGFVVREIVPGSRLSGIVLAGGAFDAMRVIGDVLDELCALEAAGRFHGDVRPWNVIVGDDGRSTLIDYGDITPDPVDCAWPGDPYLAFMVFAREVQSGRIQAPSDARAVRFAPHEFEGVLAKWSARLWNTKEPWTFSRMQDVLRDAVHGGGEPTASDLVEAERAAGERVQSLLAQRNAERVSLEGEVAALHRDKVAIQAQLDREDAAHRAARERLEAASRDAEAAGRHIAGLTKQLADAARAREEASEHAARQLAAIEALQARITALEEAGATLEAANVKLGEANARLASSADALHASLVKLGEAHAALTAQCEALDRERIEARTEAHRWWQQSVEWHREWEAIQRTLSWRVTTPLRWAKRSFVSSVATVKQGPAAIAQPAIAALARPLVERPELRYRVATITRKFPALHARLRDVVKPASQASATEPGIEAADDAPAYLTPRARRALADIRRGGGA